MIRSRGAEDICNYRGGQGLRGTMENCGYALTNVEVDDQAVRRDVDTPQEYQDLLICTGRNEAEFLSGAGRKNGVVLEKNLLYHACIFHDFCRTEGKNHPMKAGKILRKSGFDRIAEIVEQHHDLSEKPSPESEILYLADKLMKGTEQITLEQRFSASRIKCKTKEARDVWGKRYTAAKKLYEKYNADALV